MKLLSGIHWKAFSLLTLLIASSFLALNIGPTLAQTATIDRVEHPSIVRAGETFHVGVFGTYETSEPMDLRITIIQQSDSSELARSPYDVDPPPDVITRSDWQLGFDLEAYTPDPGEYDGDGRYLWELTSVLHGFGNVEFTVTIIEPDADPYVDIMRVYAIPIGGEEGDPIYVGDLVDIYVALEISVPSVLESHLQFLGRDSLGLIRGLGEPTGDEGWIDLFLPLENGYFEEILPVVAPLDPMDNWLWEFRIEAETVDERSTSDEDSFTVQILERVDRWAHIIVGFHPALAAPGEDIGVEIFGTYVFPGDASGDLELEIVYASDMSPIEGGETQTIPDLSDRGPFSQVFSITAPDALGTLELLAVLRFSDTLDPVDEFVVDIEVVLGVVPDEYYCRIESVTVNRGIPPQDVVYGESFTVEVEVAWNLPAPAFAAIFIWDWDRIAFPITGDYQEIFDPGEITREFIFEVERFQVPARNGPWPLRATAYYSVMGPLDFTEDGFEQFFDVNVIGADGIVGGNSDWSIMDVWVSPVDPFLGTDVTFIATIGVTTGDPLPQEVTVSYSIDGVEEQDILTHEGGDFLMVSSPPWMPTLGTHTVRWEIDPDEDYDDPNRLNNVAELSFTVVDSPPIPPGWEPPAEDGGVTEEFDFYVTAVPTEQSLSSPATFTVTVDITSGTPEPVELEVMSIPAGASYYFDPPSGTPSYTSTLTITTSADLPAGTYPLSIKAVGGGKERYKPITLIVENGPDYSLSITPSSTQAKPGETVTYTVSASSDSGYSQYVNLMISGVPEGATYQLEPKASQPSFQSTLTLELSEDTTPGVYRLTVAGSGVDGKRASVTLRVEGTRAIIAEDRTVDYLAAAILGLILAAIVGGAVFAVKRLRGRKAKVFCIECGAVIKPGIEYCTKCGTKQVKNEKV